MNTAKLLKTLTEANHGVKHNKKGQINLTNSLMVAFTAILLIAVIFLAMGYISDIQQDLRDDQTAGTPAYEIMDTGLNDTLDRTGDVSSIGDIGIAVIIIGLLVSGFFGGVIMAMRRT